MATYPVVKIDGDRSGPAPVEVFTLTNGTAIPALIVGEEGRGRRLGVVPVKGAEERTLLEAATIGQTRRGRPSLTAASMSEDELKAATKFIAVFSTKIGFRGSNSHTGDRKELVYWKCPNMRLHHTEPVEGFCKKEEVPEVCPHPECGDYARPEFKLQFENFPQHDLLTEGVIAEGDAGRMGSGRQFIALMPAGVVFRTGYSGRLYGEPAAHYHVFEGGKLLTATWNERELTDIF